MLTIAKKSRSNDISQVTQDQDKKNIDLEVNSPRQDSERGTHRGKSALFYHIVKQVSNLTLEEYMLNYGQPYRNKSMKKIESNKTWRVVNEDPSESFITVDEEFENETVDPLYKSFDSKRLGSNSNERAGKQTSSCKREGSTIKLSILSVMKKNALKMGKKIRSTSRVLDDMDRKVCSPLLSHAMSAFFNSTKAPLPTGPKSIRMSSNASALYPIREEGGKISIDEDVLDEVDSSPTSSVLKDALSMSSKNSLIYFIIYCKYRRKKTQRHGPKVCL
jgi:hypothetical protein